jgi:NDP-sugar pyrophosphorylase family protein
MTLQSIILLSGADDLFRDAGHLYPKSLVEIAGVPLVQRVLDSLGGVRQRSSRVICTVRREEDRKYHTSAVIRLIEPRADVVLVDETAGAACSALLAIEHLSVDDPLVVINGDQLLRLDILEMLDEFKERDVDGGIVVFEAVHPRWSYVRCDSNGLVVEAAEKRPISNLATAGIYYFKRAGDFISATMSMIKKNAHVGNSYYVCPIYNELVLRQARIGIIKVPKSEYFSLATPSSVEAFQTEVVEKRTGDR